MPRTRTVSRGLPAGVLRLPRARFYYVLVPATTGEPAHRLKTPYAVESPESRDRAARAATALRILRPLPRFAALLATLKSGHLSLDTVVDAQVTGGTDAVWSLVTEAEVRTRTSAPGLTLHASLDAFRQDTLSVHPKKRGRVISARTRRHDAAHVREALEHIARQSGKPTAELTVPDITTARITVYLEHVVARTKQRHGRATRGLASVQQPRPTDARDEAARTAQAGRVAQRKHLLALRMFLRYHHIRLGLRFNEDPTADVLLPTLPKGRIHFLEQPDCELLVETLEAQGSAAAAVYATILHCTSLDTSDVCELRVADVDRETWAIESRSRKTDARRRSAKVMPWGRGRIDAWCAARAAADGPMALLFPDWAKWRNARDPYARLHRAACDALAAEGRPQFADYQPRDARHSVAVQMARAGVSINVIARQLGSNPRTVAAVYTRFIPDGADWDDAFERMEKRRSRLTLSR